MGEYYPPPVSVGVENRSIDSLRPLRVIIIGSGISGILSSIRFRQRIPHLSLQVYERNADIGGTWYENRYPGCACDIPAHTYQATFEPNLEWSQFYASSPEIHKYWKKVAHRYDCMPYIKLRHEVVQARWDDQSSKWVVEIRNKETQETIQDWCNVLISGTGALNNWQMPNIPGINSFKGKLLHSAAWDSTFDWQDKKVAVIGNGSSGIQIVPAMLPKANHLYHYIRGKTWLSPTFARNKVDEMAQGLDNFHFTPEVINQFSTDKPTYHKFRKDIELELQSAHPVTIRNTPEQIGALSHFTENMKKRLSAKPEMVDQLLPSFPPVCRRLTPGPGYLEALTHSKCTVVMSRITEITETGIKTEDGSYHEVDAIVCATGFNTTFTPRFPIVGKHGTSLSDRWSNGPDTYLSVAVDHFPNFFICLGPNAALGAGNLLNLIEREIDYFTMCVAKLQRESLSSMTVRSKCVEDFVRYCDDYFKDTVFSMKCRSWYKGGKSEGRIIALWPGSALHAMKVFQNPRWEDFEYESVGGHAAGWLGDGWTEAERNNAINVDYLDDDQIDFPVPAADTTQAAEAPVAA